MKKQYLFILLFAGLLMFFNACKRSAHYDALIVTGQNTENWQASNTVLKQLLDQTGLFKTDIILSPEKGGDMTTFNPDFSKYDLVVLDYNGDPWTAKTDTAFVQFVRNGGGVVVYRAADNAFPDWKEYNRITGLGGWGNRDEKSGPVVYYNRRNEIVRDDTSKVVAGTLGERNDFPVKTRNSEHPVTKGLPVNWLHGSDQLFGQLRGPAENMEILATGSSGARGFNRPPAPPPAAAGAAAGFQGARASQGAPGNFANRTFQMPRDEPVLMAITYGKGRIFHTTLGLAEEGGGPAMQCVGFIVTFQRGAEWAASGNVTQEVPFDFPTAAGVVLRPDFKILTLDEAIENIGSYDNAKSTKNITFIRDHIRKIAEDEQALLDVEKKMTGVLKSDEASVDSKKLLLRELSWMGSDYSIPAIQELVSNPDLKDEAQFALDRLQQ